MEKGDPAVNARIEHPNGDDHRRDPESHPEVTDAAHIPACVKVRAEVMDDVKPAFMRDVIQGMMRPGIPVEIEAVSAAR